VSCVLAVVTNEFLLRIIEVSVVASTDMSGIYLKEISQ
jgi:hypothetical protein